MPFEYVGENTLAPVAQVLVNPYATECFGFPDRFLISVIAVSGSGPVMKGNLLTAVSI
jgi:hypothetical protein